MPISIIGLTLVTQNFILLILVLVVVLVVLAWLGGLFTHPKPAPEPTTPKDAGTPDMPTVSENIRNAFKMSGTELHQYVENMRILGIAEMIAEDFEHTQQLCTRNASLFARAADECLEETKRIVAEAEARQRSLSRCLLDWKMNAARQRAIAEKCSVILGMLNTPETPTGEPPAPPASFQPALDTPSGDVDGHLSS